MLDRAWLRNKVLDLEQRSGDLNHRPPGLVNNGAAAFFGQVVSGGAMFSAVDRYFYLKPIARVPGPPTEGGAATIAWKASRVRVLVVGDHVPVVGDVLLARYEGYRWVAESHSSVTNPCQGHANNLTFQLVGCNGCPVPGATVNFQIGGVTVYTATTNASGVATYPEPPPGTYTVAWSITAYGKTYSGTSFPSTLVVGSGCNSPSAGTPFGSITASVGYTCWAACPLPLPQLYITDAGGTRPNGTCIVAPDGRPFIASFTPGGPCGGPNWGMTQVWAGTPTTCTELSSFNVCNCFTFPPGHIFADGTCGYTTGVAGLGGCQDPFLATGTYDGNPTTCFGAPAASSPITGGFTVHT